ncbi:hypothetical protein E2562_001772 [Oryza meyeriana var. granulata]|uniref:DUF599 domain-containing protein n=1 Tax=Oryza meyeriana var. granulata TaxID=110450 RepID=A0A6G1CD91_9ORYZ|nr:hypothetical protein E2562_001772 [Oryza meyeriana var. granulata]
MAWKDGYLDLVLIPAGVLFPIVYHLWLWRVVRRRPLCSTVGINAATRRLWLFGMMKDNEKKAVLVVQSMRNVIMGSTLMATTAILFCTGVAAILSSTYTVKKPLSDTVFGAHGEYMMALKYVTLLLVFLLSFLSHTAAICTLNQATFLVNTLPSAADLPVTKDYIADVLEKGFLLNLVGNRLFYAGVPLLLWIFGPVLACLCSIVMIPILHSIDMVYVESGSSKGSEVNASTVEMVYESDESVMQV